MLLKILLQNPIFVQIVPKIMEVLIKVLFIVTSHSEMGHTGLKTGWFLKEVAYPYDVFTKASFQVDFMSPKGGLAPMVMRVYKMIICKQKLKCEINVKVAFVELKK